MSQAADIRTNEDLIIAACLQNESAHQQPPKLEHIRSEVIRYASDMIVKYGNTVYAQEARNQRFAHRNLDPSIVRVPQVYHFFEREQIGECPESYCGFLVMEYIQGEHCPTIPTTEQTWKVAEAIKHMRNYRGDAPGPVEGGWTNRLGHLFWEEDVSDVQFIDAQDLEDFWNARLFREDGQLLIPTWWKDGHVELFRFHEENFVFSHLAINPDKIIFCPDGTLALLHWSNAGFWPKIFKYASLRGVFGSGPDFDDMVLAELALTAEERSEKYNLAVAVWDSFRFSTYITLFKDLEEPPVIKECRRKTRMPQLPAPLKFRTFRQCCVVASDHDIISGLHR